MKDNIVPLAGIVMVLIAGAFMLGLGIGQNKMPEVGQLVGMVSKTGERTATIPSEPERADLTTFWTVWDILDQKFIPFGTSTEVVSKVGVEERLYGSIEGLVSSYNDPYTVFMRPQQAADFKIVTQGSLEGIGAVVGDRDGAIIIVLPLPDSPADKAGLMAGDHITAVDGMATEGLLVDKAVERIRGPRGTPVVLTISREGGEPRDVTVVRGRIEIPSTSHAIVTREVPETAGTSEGTTDTAPRDFYHLRLFTFSQTSISSFERELREFLESGAEYLILDLRGNPGGYLEAAVRIASRFLPNDTVVVREFRGPEMQEVLHTTQGGSWFPNGTPAMVVLVDKGSASASEILAGALQEQGVATVIGTPTFGKGSVQELININDTLSLKVTVARWYTAEGVSISDGGLTPDILIDLEAATSSDPWIDAAVKFLTQ
jgi:carboxyl-terminal processing protease